MMYPPGPETDKLKKAFAAAFLRNPMDAYAAARTVETHIGKASWIAANWIMDAEVLAFMTEMQSTAGVTSMLPTKEEFALQVLTASHDVADKADKLKYLDLFAKVMGFVEKPGNGGVHVGTMNVNKVMTRIAFESPEAFERAAMARQARLVEHAAS